MDNPPLLSALLHDADRATAPWRATPYWATYERRMIRELRRVGLEGWRRNQRLLKGWAFGGHAVPDEPQRGWKRVVWRLLDRGPLVTAWRRCTAAEHRHRIRAEVTLARIALDGVAEHLPVRVPPGLATGDAEDAFEWSGHQVTAEWVQHLTRIADFYLDVPPSRVTSVLEIGAGLGMSTLAHVALNPHVRTMVNVDLPTVLYVQSRFLDAAVGANDYLSIRSKTGIRPGSGIWCIPTWSLPAIDGQFDLVCNAFSFQEMERDVVAAYAQEINRLDWRFVLLHSSLSGHKPGAGGQAQPIPLEDILHHFKGERHDLQGLWASTYASEGEAAVLIHTS